MKYVQNTHTNGMVCKTKDGELSKRFPVIAWDKVTGQRLATGFTQVSDEELAKLEADCPLFVYFVSKKKLVVHKELPEEAQMPHEALSAAKQNAGKLEAHVKELQKENEVLLKENEALKKALADAGK